MELREKLQLLQKALGLTQDELSTKLDVTFATLNRWINGHALPHRGKRAEIDELLRELTGEKKQLPTSSNEVKLLFIQEKQRSLDIITLIQTHSNIRDELDVALTYHSNRIEGSTLTENETYRVLFENRPVNKSLREQLEAKNHQTALHEVFDLAATKKPIQEEDITRLHGMLMNGVHPDAGAYRRYGVRILGSRVVTANHLKVPALMANLMHHITEKPKNFFQQCAYVHAQFEKIHPFADGNGRIGRLLLNLMLLKHNLPPALILQSERQKYFDCLQKAQLKEDYRMLEEFLSDAVLKGFQLFI